MGGYFLAVDIGASSGRHIVGWREDHELRTKEVYRFPNGAVEENGHLVWDVDALLTHVKAGIEAALDEFGGLESLSIDTWGCDYVLLRDDGEVRPCYAYRDGRTEAVIPQVHERVSFEELYAHTGCQFQPFNTVYQLCDDLQRGRLEGVTDFLMVPEYLMWKLTGVKAREYTNAATTGLMNAQTGEFDLELVRRLGLPERLFPTLSQPGTVIGAYKGIKVVLCATHDTGSAVEGIPMEGEQLYISSGTWSLLGVKTPRPLTDERSRAANYSNEGGVGYTRYQKNIMGMWIVNRLRDELCPDKAFPDIVQEAEASTFDGTVDANAPVFLAPESMRAAFDASLSADVSQSAGASRSADVSQSAGASRSTDASLSADVSQSVGASRPADVSQSAGASRSTDASLSADVSQSADTSASRSTDASQSADTSRSAGPDCVGDYFRCAYRSLALSYREAIRELEENLGRAYEKLYIVGGGAKNEFLNRLTAEATGKEVIALPIEATALGNLKIQISRQEESK